MLCGWYGAKEPSRSIRPCKLTTISVGLLSPGFTPDSCVPHLYWVPCMLVARWMANRSDVPRGSLKHSTTIPPRDSSAPLPPALQRTGRHTVLLGSRPPLPKVCRLEAEVEASPASYLLVYLFHYFHRQHHSFNCFLWAKVL